ncbi:MAG TPA: hypothetical protein VHO25_19405 [Polyangiaceae bacterium]|nr:hypothetical protein [Polyangiaceae bacterium]
MTTKGVLQVFRASTLFLAILGCSHDPDEPCFKWLHIGDTYGIRVLDHFTLENPGPNTVFPYEGYAANEKSCGNDFDFQSDDEFEMIAANRAEDLRGNSGCFPVRAQISEFPHEEGEGEVRGIYGPGTAAFSDALVINRSETCRGTQTMGLAQVAQPFIEQSPQPVPSGWMFFRSFVPFADADQCGVVFGGSTTACWDSWYVEVRGPDGAPVSD